MSYEDILKEFYVLLTVHLSIIFVNNQLDMQFLFHVCLLLFSTCFGQPRAHHQENCINTTSGIGHSI